MAIAQKSGGDAKREVFLPVDGLSGSRGKIGCQAKRDLCGVTEPACQKMNLCSSTVGHESFRIGIEQADLEHTVVEDADAQAQIRCQPALGVQGHIVEHNEAGCFYINGISSLSLLDQVVGKEEAERADGRM